MEELKNKILIVEDEMSSRLGLVKALKKAGHDAVGVGDAETGFALLKQEFFDILITDVRLPKMSGLELLKKIKELDPDITVILITAYADVKDAVDAMKHGAYDYIIKPVDIHRLRALVKQALQYQKIIIDNRHLKRALRNGYPFEEMLSASKAMEEVYQLINQVAATHATVLITGESGTGKELVAHAIHHRSDRNDGTFVTLNCGALPDTLLEAELFGHEKGAFTDAAKLRKGKIELADKGTLFLDEVSEMSLRTQVDFLRVIEQGEVTRIGGDKPIPVDVRFIAATNKNLLETVKEGVFREDLFHRLNVVPINIPPLRERREDIPLLACEFIEHFCEEYKRHRLSLARQTIRALKAYDWPGNVRELKNLMERLVLTVNEDLLRIEHLPEQFHPNKEEERQIQIPVGSTVEEAEKRLIEETLGEVDGHREKAAKILGISVRALHYKLNKYHIK